MKSYTPEKAKAGQKKLEKLLEFSERRDTMKRFMKFWNRWRAFYLKCPPLDIKTPAQLTVIENAMDFCKEKKMDLNLAIACLHKSFERSKKMRPAFHMLMSMGEEKYRCYLDQVESDIEMAEMEKLSLGET